MADAAAALVSLQIKDWVLDGTPTNETEFKKMFRKVVGEDEDGNGILSSDPNDFGVTWSQVSAKISDLNDVEPIRLLREERNRKLAETDWMAGQDRTMSQAEKDYRQALRDITNSYTSLDDVVWPTKP